MSTVVFLINEKSIVISADSQTTCNGEVYDCNARKIFPLNDKLALFAMGDARIAINYFDLLGKNRRKERMFSSCRDFVDKMTRSMEKILLRDNLDNPIQVTFGCGGLSDGNLQCAVVTIDSTNMENPIKSKFYSLQKDEELCGDVFAPSDLPPIFCATKLCEVVSVHSKHSSLEDLLKISNQTVLEISERSKYVSPPVRYWAYDIEANHTVSNVFD